MKLDTKVKALQVENKRLLALNAKLSGNNESMYLQLKQKDDALAKRRSEVATLHQACAKYKRAQFVFAKRIRNPTTSPFSVTSHSKTTPLLPTDVSTSTRQETSTLYISTATFNQPTQPPDAEQSKPSTTSAEPVERVAVCSRCERMRAFFDEVGKRSDKMAKLIDEQEEQSRRMFDESEQRSQAFLSETHEQLNQIRERGRQRIAEALQRNQQQMVQFRRRRDGFADAG